MVMAFFQAPRNARLTAVLLAFFVALAGASDASARERRAPRVRPAPPPPVQTYTEPSGAPVLSPFNRCGACGTGGGG